MTQSETLRDGLNSIHSLSNIWNCDNEGERLSKINDIVSNLSLQLRPLLHPDKVPIETPMPVEPDQHFHDGFMKDPCDICGQPYESEVHFQPKVSEAHQAAVNNTAQVSEGRKGVHLFPKINFTWPSAPSKPETEKIPLGAGALHQFNDSPAPDHGYEIGEAEPALFYKPSTMREIYQNNAPESAKIDLTGASDAVVSGNSLQSPYHMDNWTRKGETIIAHQPSEKAPPVAHPYADLIRRNLADVFSELAATSEHLHRAAQSLSRVTQSAHDAIVNLHSAKSLHSAVDKQAEDVLGL